MGVEQGRSKQENDIKVEHEFFLYVEVEQEFKSQSTPENDMEVIRN